MNNNLGKKAWFIELGEVIRLSLPIIVTMSSHTMMQFVDQWMVSRYGKAELAAVSPSGLTFFTIGAFMLGVMSSNNAFVSQSLGAGRKEDCSRYTIHALSLGVIAQILVIPLILFAPSLFSLYGHSAEIEKLEVVYFRILAFRLAGMSFVSALSAFFQGIGRPAVPMITGILANILNVIGDYLFIFGKFGFPEWGIAGAGLMTTVATYFEVILILYFYFSKPFNDEFGTRHLPKYEFKRIKQILYVGLGSGVTFGLDLASWTIFIGYFLGRLGEDVLAGNNAASAIMHLSFMPAVGLNIGVTALVGRYIGKGDIPAAKRRAYLAMGCACAYMTLMGIIFFVFREQLISIFRTEPAVVQAGSVILTYVALFQFSDAIGILSSGALRGAGDTRWPALLQILLAWCLFLPMVWYFGSAERLGVHGAWLSATVYIWVYDALLFWRFYSERWRKINIFG